MNENETLNLLKTARAALMSYQYGNQSTELAKEIVEFIDTHLEEIGEA